MSIATNQATVDTTSGGVLIAAARVGRRKITITNGAAVIAVGGKGLTLLTGLVMAANATVTLETSEAVWGISGSSSVVSCCEQY